MCSTFLVSGGTQLHTSPSVILIQALKTKRWKNSSVLEELTGLLFGGTDIFIWGQKHLMEKSKNLEEAEWDSE